MTSDRQKIREERAKFCRKKRESGATWTDIAEELGVTPEALWASKRHRLEGRAVPLNDRDLRVLCFIQSYQKQSGGVTPSYSIIAKNCGLASKSQVADAVAKLERSEMIFRLRDRHAAIEVLKPVSRRRPPFKGAIPIYDARTNEIRSWIA